jgi:hypothetical protein
LKSGHRTALLRLPSVGTEYRRDQNSAPKKAPKNITSEKMNQLMLQRKDTSMRSPYRPPSLSLMAWPNHWRMVKAHSSRPNSSAHLAASVPLIQKPAPMITKNRPVAAITGKREGAGMK